MLKDLTHFSDEELKSELEKRKKNSIPKMIENPDLTNLKHALQIYINTISQLNYNEDYDKDDEDEVSYEDMEHYIYELTLKTFFGYDVFDWINENI